MDKLNTLDIQEKENKERLYEFINLRWIEKLTWLINLRWLAVIGVFIVVTIARYVLQIELPFFYLYLGNLVLFLYNILFFFYNQRLKLQENKDSQFFRKANYFANLQILLDLIMLSYLIHFSGGAENPFVFYFIFHMVIASILLSNRMAYMHLMLAIILLGLVIGGEYFGYLTHYHLNRFVNKELCLEPQYLLGIFSVFVTTLYITVYMTTWIVNRLRKEEKELVIANKKLGEQERLKSQYVLIVAHEIQSSLSTIQTCLKVVLDNLTGPISEKAREMIARAEQRSRYVLDFVKDLLDLSKIRAEKEKKLNKEIVSLSSIVNNVINQLKTKIDEKSLNLKTSFKDILVNVDRDSIERVFVNLLGNAIKYTPAGGKIVISFETSANNFVNVSISDTGIGIPSEDLPHIFEDFYRANNARTLDKDGTGLGLSIVKQIIESHNGKVWVESQLGRGSKFTFVLPRVNPETEYQTLNFARSRGE